MLCVLIVVLVAMMVQQVASFRLMNAHSRSILKKTMSVRAGHSETNTGSLWDSHIAVDQIPSTLVSAIDGNESMRRKFEELCRNAQVKSYLH